MSLKAKPKNILERIERNKNKMNIRFIGRHILKDGKEYFSYSGTGFEFVVIPESDECFIELKLKSVLHEHDEQYVAIYVDDVFYNKEKLIEGANTIKIKVTKKAVIKLIKLNEVYLSAIYLNDIVIHNGKLGEIEPSNKKLVGFFGDSITCGYGVIGLHDLAFKPETEDFTKSCAFLGCFAANMDYSVVARSGISISIPIYQEKLFGEIYDTVDMYEKGEEDRKLDVAVINLGTNDNNGYLEIVKDVDKPQALETFKKKYIELVERIVKDNPGVKLIFCYDMIKLIDDFVDAIKNVYQHITSNFDNECKLLKFVPNTDGANFHPYKDAQAESAKVLAEALREFD